MSEKNNIFYIVEYLDENGYWHYDEGSETSSEEFALKWREEASKNSSPENFRTLKVEVIDRHSNNFSL